MRGRRVAAPDAVGFQAFGQDLRLYGVKKATWTRNLVRRGSVFPLEVIVDDAVGLMAT